MLTTKVFLKCLSNSSIEGGLTMKGDIFDHLQCDSFFSGKGGDLLEIVRKNGGTPCALHVIVRREKNEFFYCLEKFGEQKKNFFERK